MDNLTMILGIISIVLMMLVILWIGLKVKYRVFKSPNFPLDGDLIIDTKDPYKDVLRFELYYDPEILLNEAYEKEFVHFRIVRNNKKEI